MKEVKYMISDTAKKVNVEAHVLRYWEEELEIPIGRNEMGHRYYTKENIDLFRNIKDLKEQGFQLKAIKMLLPELMLQGSDGIDNLLILKEELNYKANSILQEPTEEKLILEESDFLELPAKEMHDDAIHEDKILQFQEILSQAVKKALRENNQDLGKDLGRQVSTHIIKEMDYLERIRDEKQEDRFRQLDEAIRNYQRSRQETATVQKKGFFSRKKSASITKKGDV